MRARVCLVIVTLVSGVAQAQAAKVVPVAGFRTDVVKCFEGQASAGANLCAAGDFRFPQDAAVSVGGGRLGVMTKGGRIRWVLTADVRGVAPHSEPSLNPLTDEAPATRGERAASDPADTLFLPHGAQDVIDVADASNLNVEQPLDRVGFEEKIVVDPSLKDLPQSPQGSPPSTPATPAAPN